MAVTFQQTVAHLHTTLLLNPCFILSAAGPRPLSHTLIQLDLFIHPRQLKARGGDRRWCNVVTVPHTQPAHWCYLGAHIQSSQTQKHTKTAIKQQLLAGGMILTHTHVRLRKSGWLCTRLRLGLTPPNPHRQPSTLAFIHFIFILLECKSHKLEDGIFHFSACLLGGISEYLKKRIQ